MTRSSLQHAGSVWARGLGPGLGRAHAAVRRSARLRSLSLCRAALMLRQPRTPSWLEARQWLVVLHPSNSRVPHHRSTARPAAFSRPRWYFDSKRRMRRRTRTEAIGRCLSIAGSRFVIVSMRRSKSKVRDRIHASVEIKDDCSRLRPSAVMVHTTDLPTHRQHARTQATHLPSDAAISGGTDPDPLPRARARRNSTSSTDAQ